MKGESGSSQAGERADGANSPSGQRFRPQLARLSPAGENCFDGSAGDAACGKHVSVCSPIAYRTSGRLRANI